MHRIAVIVGVILCLVAIVTYSLWPVEEEEAIVDQPAAEQGTATPP